MRFEAGKVTFRYREGREGQHLRITLKAEEFVRRFLQHVLPRGFTRVRHYGCFSPGSAKKLALARSLLEGLEAKAPTNQTSQAPPNQAPLREVDVDVESSELAIDEEEKQPPERRCPFCKKGRMRRIGEIPRAPRVRCAPTAPP